MEEQWMVIRDFPDYEVSSLGYVRRKTARMGTRAGKVLSAGIKDNGYHQVVLYKLHSGRKNRYVHRLVAEAFLAPDPQRKQVNHKDGNKDNNAASNLEYVTSIQYREEIV